MTSFRTKPKPPISVSAVVAGDGANVSWSSPPVQGQPVLGLVLYRNGIEAASLSALVRGYSDPSIPAYTSISYQLTVVSATGTRSAGRSSDTVFRTIAQPDPTLTTKGSRYEEYAYNVGGGNYWRTSADVINGWDWSYPPGSLVGISPYSGAWQFAATQTPYASYPGKTIRNIFINWKDFQPDSESGVSAAYIANLRSIIEGAENGNYYVQFGIRGSTRKGSRDLPEGGGWVITTCPTWLESSLPTEGIHWFKSVEGGGTLYLYAVWHPVWQQKFETYLRKLFGLEAIPGFPGGLKFNGYTIPNHPRVLGCYIHCSGGNVEEDTGTVVNMMRADDSLAADYVNWLLDTWPSLWNNNAKLCNTHNGLPWGEITQPILEAGIGTRGPPLTEFWAAPRNSPRQFSGVRSCIEVSAYRDVNGVVRTTSDFGAYPVYHALESGANWPPNRQNIAPQHLRCENEIWKFTNTDEEVGACPKSPPPMRYPLNYRMAVLRAFQGGYVTYCTEPRNTRFHNYGGAEEFINPPLVSWFASQAGRKLEYPDNPVNEVWCALNRYYAKAYCSLASATRTMQVHNTEYWMYQREPYGATTSVLRCGCGVDPAIGGDPADAEAPPGYTGGVGAGSQVNDAYGEPMYQWSPTAGNITDSTMWHVHLARTGPTIGFEIDTRFFATTTPLAIKVVYWDANVGPLRLRYRNASGAEITSSTVTTAGALRVKTATWFVSNLKLQAAGSASLSVISNGTLPIMFVRVIKT